MFSAHYFCQILMKVVLSSEIFEKYSNIKFHDNPSNASRVAPFGQTDGRTANSRFSPHDCDSVCNLAKKSKIKISLDRLEKM